MPAKAKPPSHKTIKSLFKAIGGDLAPKLAAELARGIDPDVTYDASGFGAVTALMYAIAGGKLACVELLLAAGADVTRRGERGDCVLHHVRDAALAAQLIARGAPVDVADSSRRTPLHVACQRGRRELAALLLDHGASVAATDADGRTPYALAHDVELRALLRRYGAKRFPAGGGRVLKPKAKTARWKDLEVDRGAIGLDGAGRLWCGGHNGVFRFDGASLVRWQFTETFAIDSIAAGPPGVVYIATNWGLVVFANDTFTLYDSESSELFDHHLVYLRTGPDGRAYMLSYENEAKEKHITVFDGRVFTLLSPGVEFPRGLAIQCLAFDAAGNLVIGADGGIAVQRAGAWQTITKLGSEQTFPPHVYDIAVAGATLWIGTASGVYEYTGDRFTLHRTDNLAKCVCVDGDRVWIGMYFGGLGCLRGGELTVATAATSALPADDVERVVRAPDGTVWIHAGSDIARVTGGVLERMTGEPATSPASPRSLLAFPPPIVARAKLPRPVVAAIEQLELASVTADQLLAVVRPAIALDCVKYKTVDVGASKLGGQPDLPPRLAWPAFADAGARIPFVLQIDLAAAHAFDKEQLLPATGMLYVFADTSPGELRGSRVLYSDAPRARLARRAFPDDVIARLPEYKIELRQTFTLPPNAYLRARAELSDADMRVLDALRAALAKLAGHRSEASRLLGWGAGDDPDRVELLQLAGTRLSPKGIEKVFEHRPLIRFAISAKSLANRKLDRADGAIAYT